MSAPSADPGLRGSDLISEEGEERDTGNVPEENLPATFYPLRQLLGELVKQESELWEKTHGVRFAAVSGTKRLAVGNGSKKLGGM